MLWLFHVTVAGATVIGFELQVYTIKDCEFSLINCCKLHVRELRLRSSAAPTPTNPHPPTRPPQPAHLTPPTPTHTPPIRTCAPTPHTATHYHARSCSCSGDSNSNNKIWLFFRNVGVGRWSGFSAVSAAEAQAR